MGERQRRERRKALRIADFGLRIGKKKGGNRDRGPGTRKGIADFGLRIAEWKAKAQAKVRLAASRRRPRVLGLPRAT